MKAKPWKSNVLLLALSLLSITKTDGNIKPPKDNLYEFTKGDTDDCNKRSELCCCKPYSRKCTTAVIYHVLNMVRTNACTIFDLNRNEFPPKNYLSLFGFGWNLKI